MHNIVSKVCLRCFTEHRAVWVWIVALTEFTAVCVSLPARGTRQQAVHLTARLFFQLSIGSVFLSCWRRLAATQVAATEANFTARYSTVPTCTCTIDFIGFSQELS